MGGTGEGKTSLLEAIYLAVTTRSFKTRQIANCLKGQEGVSGDTTSGSTPPSEGFHTLVEVEGEARARLEFGWSRTEGNLRRLNGDRSSLEEHLKHQPILAWSGAEIDVLIGPPDLRRRLIDRVSVGLDSKSLSVLSRYRRTLEHKRALLAPGGKAQTARMDLDALHSFNTVLAESSERLIHQRHSTIEKLRESLSAVCSAFPRPNFAVDLTYQSSPGVPQKINTSRNKTGHTVGSIQSGKTNSLSSSQVGWSRTHFEAAVDR